VMIVLSGVGLCLVPGDCCIVVIALKKQIQISLEFLMILNIYVYCLMHG